MLSSIRIFKLRHPNCVRETFESFQVAEQKETAVDEELAERLKRNASAQWDAFYSRHDNKFFMDRNWLLTEFPELNIANEVCIFHLLASSPHETSLANFWHCSHVCSQLNIFPVVVVSVFGASLVFIGTSLRNTFISLNSP